MIQNLFRNMPPVTKNLLIINILIYLAGAIIPGLGTKLDTYCALHYYLSPAFNPAQLFTYMFLHGSLSHLFFNMFALFMFGGLIERTLDSRRFLFYYISCGIGAALVQMGVYALMIAKYQAMFSPEVFDQIIDQGYQLMQGGLMFTDPSAANLAMLVNLPTVGASGAIYGILLAFGMLYPNMEMFVMFIPVPVKAKWVVLGYGVLEIAMGLGGANDGVAHFAHLGGMLFGFIMIYYWKKKGLWRY